MRSRVFAGILVLLASALAGTAAADEKKAAPAGPPDEKAMMEAMTKAATPGAAHKRLDPTVGKFDAKLKMWMDPSKPPEETSGTQENTWVLGNRYIEQRYQGTFLGQPFSGIGYAGYDNVAKKYVSTWMDTAGTAIMNLAGTGDPSGRVVNFTGTMLDPVTGKPAKFTEKLTIADNDHHMFEMWGPDATGKTYKMMEVTYTRKK